MIHDLNSRYEQLASTHVSLRRVVAIFRPYRWQLAGLAGLIVVASAAGLVSPFLLRAIIDDALPGKNVTLLALFAGGLVAIACLGAAITVLQTIVSARIGLAIMHDLRVRVYTHMQSMSLAFFTRTKAGEIQSRIATDIGGLQALATHTITELARDVSVVIMTATAMLALNWRLALFSFGVIPVAVWISYRVGKVREQATYEQQLKLADMAAAIQEALSTAGVVLARTMGRTRFLTRRFEQTSGDVANMEMRAQTALEWQWSLIFLLLAVLPALTLLLGGIMMNQGIAVTVGTLVAMIALQEQLLWPFQQVLDAGMQIRTTRALFARVFEYLDEPLEIVESSNPISIAPALVAGAVRIDHVSFTYPGSQAPALSNIDLDIPAGSHIAIVGSTGSGKTTLGLLLARLYDVGSGAIRFDGIDIRDLSFLSLSDTIGVVSQDTFLLHASIADNLRFARDDATDADLVAAAQMAQLHHRVMTLPQGYATVVGERGARLSGGEKQRLALARTLLRKPRILLLDEATSALDTRTENAIAKALATLPGNQTKITIAHRLSTVRAADKIVVLDKGRIAEEGTHDDLMALGGIYSDLVHRGQR